MLQNQSMSSRRHTANSVLSQIRPRGRGGMVSENNPPFLPPSIRRLTGVSLIGFYFAKGVVVKVFDQLWIYKTDEESGI